MTKYGNIEVNKKLNNDVFKLKTNSKAKVSLSRMDKKDRQLATTPMSRKSRDMGASSYCHPEEDFQSDEGSTDSLTEPHPREFIPTRANGRSFASLRMTMLFLSAIGESPE